MQFRSEEAHAVLPHEVNCELAAITAEEPCSTPQPLDSQPAVLLASVTEENVMPRKRRHRSRLESASMEVRITKRNDSLERQSGRHSPRGPFQELLGRLGEQHDQELAVLQAEIAVLKVQLHTFDGNCPSEGEAAEAPGTANVSLALPTSHDHGVHWGNVERKSIKEEQRKSIKEDGATFLMPPPRKSTTLDTVEVTSPFPVSRRPSLSGTPGRRYSTSSITRRMSRKSIGSGQHAGQQPALAAQLASLEAMEVLSQWEEKDTQRNKIHRRMSTQSTHPLRMSKVRQIDVNRAESIMRESFQNKFRIARCLGRCILHPSSLKRLFWDLIGFTLLSYDIVIIPFAGAFEPGEAAFMITMNWLTLWFWTLDMVASVTTGFQQGGVTVMVHKQIFWKYIRTWFVLDAFIVGLDWGMLISYGTNSNPGEAVRQGRSLRMLRYLRTVRLIRLLKLKRMFHEIQDHINTELLSTVFSILKTIIGLVVANHLIACAWYAIGMSGNLETPSWVRSTDMQDRGIAYRYTTSLHWSLTQFTPASMEIRAYNTVERVFSVVVLLMALVSFSSFVSTLTASITRLSAMRSNEHRQFWLLRRYLRDLQISRQLSLRVQRYCEYSWERQNQSVQERDVLLLAHLSEPLREELKAETFAPHLGVHPLIEQLQDCVRRFSACLTAVDIAKGDQVFGYGEEAFNMFFVARGELQYSVGTDEFDEIEKQKEAPQTAPANADLKSSEEASEKDSDEDSDRSDIIESVFESDWVSEAALWTQWDHLGYLEALTDCQLVAIKASTFSEVVSQNAATWSSAQKYAKRFVEELNKVERNKLTDVLERNLTFIAAKDVECIGFSPIRSNSAIIRKRERRKGFGMTEYRLRYGTRRFMFRLQLATQTACNHFLRLFR